MVFLDLNDQDEILTVEISRYVPEIIPEPDRYAFKATSQETRYALTLAPAIPA
ncbi:hypothetical protein KK062_23140 [Fulvivirgaceae bacterium PWU5]|uniref:Uncharacterized protein n=1 Tax=Dawidia cretensis TaxID=2782350 RepID=A0AAP2E137_9BACT|nr:hypothetical protein [Dawidia cretensis]MBT1711158.1 hypothetical protein [Dawidia cretensis]